MFYLLIIQTNDQDQDTHLFYTYNNLNDAYALFHTELGYRHETRKRTVCVLMNSYGDKIDKQVYDSEDHSIMEA